MNYPKVDFRRVNDNPEGSFLLSGSGPRRAGKTNPIQPRFGGAFFYVDADALYAFKNRGFGGEAGVSV